MKQLVLSVLVIVAAPAWAAKTVAVVPGDPAGIKSLDEVVVQGDRTLSAARRAVTEAEDRFYARWNSLNADRKFDIRCHGETAGDHPTRMVHRVCQPAFVEDLQQETAQDFTLSVQGAMSADGGNVVMASAGPLFMLMQEELKKRTLAMIEKDPQLKRALIERARLEQHYEALRKEKFKGRWIVWD